MSDSTELLDLSKEELQSRLLMEKDPEKIKDIMDVFSLNLKKKEALRTSKVSELQDKVLDQIDERLSKRPDNFSNSDLITYSKVFQEQITKADTALEQMTVPQVQINQQINITSDENTLSRESRKRVLDAVQAILNQAQSPVVDTVQYEEVINEEDIGGGSEKSE